MISFIMMAKNVEPFVGNAIKALTEENEEAWELIFVDDGSKDNTLSVARNWANKDPRIKAFQNPFVGKVKGTSFAYTKTSGDIIKCIDSDDVLLPGFFKFAALHDKHDVLFHSGSVVDKNLQLIANYHPNSAWLKSEYKTVAESLISFPKWTWSFRRDIAEKVFPLPENLPFEDVWFSLICKRYAKCPSFTREALYLYRQHADQTFGGILNFSHEATVFRSKRILKLIDVLEFNERLIQSGQILDFSSARKENEYLSGQAGFFSTVLRPFSIKRSIRLLLASRAPALLSWLARRQWRWEAHSRGESSR